MSIAIGRKALASTTLASATVMSIALVSIDISFWSSETTLVHKYVAK
jgi:hypothetical protein